MHLYKSSTPKEIITHEGGLPTLLIPPPGGKQMPTVARLHTKYRKVSEGFRSEGLRIQLTLSPSS